MADARVWVFFYGSFLDLGVLARADVHPRSVRTARLDGYDIALRPLADLDPSDERSVWGILATVTHDELRRLYGQDWVGRYDPFPVVARSGDGELVPALCYLSADPKGGGPAAEYVETIVDAARRHGFPPWYVARLERFRRGTGADS